MDRPQDRPLDTTTLVESLRRLGVTELEERLELSPLLAGSGLEPAEGCRCSCECDDVPNETYPDNPPMPGPDGIGLLF